MITDILSQPFFFSKNSQRLHQRSQQIQVELVNEYLKRGQKLQSPAEKKLKKKKFNRSRDDIFACGNSWGLRILLIRECKKVCQMIITITALLQNTF